MTESGPSSRRLRGVLICSELIGAMAITGERHYRVDGLPETARFESAVFSYERNAFIVYFSDDSFDVVPEGWLIPIADVPPTITQLYGEQATA